MHDANVWANQISPSTRRGAKPVGAPPLISSSSRARIRPATSGPGRA